MTNQRKIEWWASKEDARIIKENKWNFNIAIDVSKGPGSTHSNVIWQSFKPELRWTITWEVDYALNRSATLPENGESVIVDGSWQACAPGDSYDLDTNGDWRKGTGGEAGYLSVGDLDFVYPGGGNVYLVLGVKNKKTKEWDPIYIDPTVIPRRGSARYQPRESIKWWLSSQSTQSGVYIEIQGPVNSKPNGIFQSSTSKFELWTTFSFSKNSWADSPTEPPFMDTAVVSDQAFDLLSREVIFNVPVNDDLQLRTFAYLRAYLNQFYIGNEIKWLNSSRMKVSVGPYQSLSDLSDERSLSTAGNDMDARTDKGLRQAQEQEDLPSDATWTIEER